MHSSSEQVWQMLVFLGFGTVCGAVDAWRTVRNRQRKSSRFRRFWADCLFVVAATVLLFLLSLSAGAGQWRLIHLAFTAMGYGVSSAVCVPLFGAVQAILKAVYVRSYRFLQPFCSAVAHVFLFFCKKIGFFCKKGLRYKHVMMYNCNK